MEFAERYNEFSVKISDMDFMFFVDAILTNSLHSFPPKSKEPDGIASISLSKVISKEQ